MGSSATTLGNDLHLDHAADVIALHERVGDLLIRRENDLKRLDCLFGTSECGKAHTFEKLLANRTIAPFAGLDVTEKRERILGVALHVGSDSLDQDLLSFGREESGLWVDESLICRGGRARGRCP